MSVLIALAALGLLMPRIQRHSVCPHRGIRCCITH